MLDYFIRVSPATPVLPVLPVVISLLAVLISSFAAWLSREKLRLDLYNRRFDIYSHVLDFYQALIGWGGHASKESLKPIQNSFIKSFRESRFLFDPKSGIYDLLEEMHTKSFLIMGFEQVGKEMASQAPELFIEKNDEVMAAKAWFHNAIQELEVKMAPYLNFHTAKKLNW
jgi:hypothetical protein